MYDAGKIDDNQKNQSFELLDDVLIPNSRHFIIKCMVSFLKTPNEHMINLHNEEIRELARERQLKIDNAPKIVTGKSITNNSISDEISVRIPNGPCAFAIDVAATNLSRKGSIPMSGDS